MRVYSGQSFEGFIEGGLNAVFEDLEFNRCHFDNCAISISSNPQTRTIVRNVRLVDCDESGCAVEPAIIEDTIVDGLGTKGVLQVWGAVFRHVVLRGRLGKIMISWSLGTRQFDAPLVQRSFDVANDEYYRSVDWAIDISEGEFKWLEIRGVPARLIRRDPRSQIVITRERAKEGKWRGVDFSSPVVPVAIESFLAPERQEREHDLVLDAPKRDRQYQKYLQDFHLLREVGVAEPD